MWLSRIVPTFQTKISPLQRQCTDAVNLDRISVATDAPDLPWQPLASKALTPIKIL